MDEDFAGGLDGDNDIDFDLGDDIASVLDARVSTGYLPAETDVRAAVADGYELFRDLDAGTVPDYIPALASAPADAFGVCVAGVQGGVSAIGDADVAFTIQSISKVFVFALVCDALGHQEARRKLGVNSTGLPFDSVMGIELNATRTMNPMVNAGALATTSLVPGVVGRREVRSHRRDALLLRRTPARGGRRGLPFGGHDELP